MESDFKQITSFSVFAQVESTGRHAALTTMPLHEAVLARLRVESAGEQIIVLDEWPHWAKESQTAERRVGDEYARLQREYGKELLVSIYGQPHEGRLQKVMTRIHQAFVKGMKPRQIVDLGRPESDFIEAPGGTIAAPASLAMGHDADEGKRIDSSALRSTEALPDGVKGIDEEAAAEAPAVDGNLIAFLADHGWNEHQALSIARIGLECGMRSIPDLRLRVIPGIKNAEALKQVRQHLTEYAAQKVAAV